MGNSENLIKLTCNSCGAKLEITEDVERFACAHCGSEWAVRKSGGIVSLRGVEEGIERIEGHASKTAENTEVMALAVQLPVIQERIRELEKQKFNIDLKPTKINPEYKNTEKVQNNFIQVMLLISIVFFYFFYRTNDGNILFSGCGSIIVFIILIIVVYMVIPEFKTSERIPDGEQREKNNKKINELVLQLSELRVKERKLKEKL